MLNRRSQKSKDFSKCLSLLECIEKIDLNANISVILFSFIKDLSFGYIFRMASVNEQRQFVNNRRQTIV